MTPRSSRSSLSAAAGPTPSRRSHLPPASTICRRSIAASDASQARLPPPIAPLRLVVRTPRPICSRCSSRLRDRFRISRTAMSPSTPILAVCDVTCPRRQQLRTISPGCTLRVRDLREGLRRVGGITTKCRRCRVWAQANRFFAILLVSALLMPSATSFAQTGNV